MKLIGRVLAAGFMLASFTGTAFADKYDRRGTLTLNNVHIPGCGAMVESVTLKYQTGARKGKPRINGLFKWDAGSAIARRCINHSTALYLKVRGQNGSYGFIRISPSVPESGKGYGGSTSNSPNWANLICGSGAKHSHCLSAKSAKRLFYSGYSITGFEVHTLNIPTATSGTPSDRYALKARHWD